MSSKPVPFSFPLCLLSFGFTIGERLDAIIYFNIFEKASSITDPMGRLRELQKQVNIEYPHDYSRTASTRAPAMIAAAAELGINLFSIKGSIAWEKRIYTFISEYEKVHGKDAYAMVTKNICFSTRDGQFDYELFAIMAAIQSIIGKSEKVKFKRITREQILYRMNGYKTKNIFDTDRRTRNNEVRYGIAVKSTPVIELKPDTMKRRIDKLVQLNLIKRFTYRHRQTYYSTRLDYEELVKAVYSSKDYNLERKINETRIEAEAVQNHNCKVAILMKNQRLLKNERLRVINPDTSEDREDNELRIIQFDKGSCSQPNEEKLERKAKVLENGVICLSSGYKVYPKDELLRLAGNDFDTLIQTYQTFELEGVLYYVSNKLSYEEVRKELIEYFVGLLPLNVSNEA